MSRKVVCVALFYLFTALVCFLPAYQFGYKILLMPGFAYGLPFAVVGWGVIRRRDWGRKLAMILSFMVILIVSPLLFKKHLTFVFSVPYSIAVTYPSSSAGPFKTLFGILAGGHFFSLLALLRGSVKREFRGGKRRGARSFRPTLRMRGIKGEAKRKGGVVKRGETMKKRETMKRKRLKGEDHIGVIHLFKEKRGQAACLVDLGN